MSDKPKIGDVRVCQTCQRLMMKLTIGEDLTGVTIAVYADGRIKTAEICGSAWRCEKCGRIEALAD